jgi:hypothetical protein
MRCPFCSGDPPLYEPSVERPHVIQTDFWYAVSDLGPIPDHFMRFQFDAGEGELSPSLPLSEISYNFNPLAPFIAPLEVLSCGSSCLFCSDCQ